MAKIGSQGRLLIPRDLTDLLKISGKVGVFWDEKESKIYLNCLEKSNDEYCICVRTIDNKNRIALPENILKLMNGDRSSKFVIAVRNGRIYIFKVGKENETGTET